MSSLDHLIHPFVPQYHKWARFVNPRTGFFSNDIPRVNFGTGFLVSNQFDIMEYPHLHEATCEFFVFTGAELDRIFEAEFQVDFFLGDSANSMELYHITKPTVVCVPPSVWHCPIVYKKVVRGINTMILFTGANWGKVLSRLDENGNEELYYEAGMEKHCEKDPTKKCTYCGECISESYDGEAVMNKYLEKFYQNAAPRSGKYDKYIYELRKDEHKLGDAVMNPRAVFKGIDDVDIAEHQFSFNIVTKPVKLGDDEPVSNGQQAEYLWFSGTDVTCEFECFDAEIEVEVGKDPEHMEKLIIDKPAVITIPPGYWRGAVTVKRVGKPLCFIPWYQHTEKRYKITQKLVDGKRLLVYNDEDTIANPTPGDELFLQIKR